MRFRGHRVKVKLTLTHVSWKPLNPHSGCWIERRRLALKREDQGAGGGGGGLGGGGGGGGRYLWASRRLTTVIETAARPGFSNALTLELLATAASPRSLVLNDITPRTKLALLTTPPCSPLPIHPAVPFEEVLSAMPLAKPSMCCCPRVSVRRVTDVRHVARGSGTGRPRTYMAR